MRRRGVFALAAFFTPSAIFACNGIAGIRDLSLAGALLDAADAPTDEDVAATDAALAWSSHSLDASPLRMTLDGVDLYWTTYSGTGSGALVRAPKMGGAPETVATGVLTANAIALDDDYVYVTSGANFNDGVVTRLAKDGGASYVVATDLSAPLGIAADDAAVYWADLGDGGSDRVTGRVVRVDKASGASKDLATGLVIPTGVALDESAVYYSTSGIGDCDGGGESTGTIERVAPDGTAHSMIAENQDCPGPVVLHDTRIFWTNVSYGVGTVNVAPKAGGTATTLATMQPYPVDLATDGTHVYWLNAQVVGGTVLGCSIVDCASSLVTISAKENAPDSIAIDESSLFWADLGVPPKQLGSVHRLTLPGLP